MLSLEKISNKQLAIVGFAAAQIAFGIVTLFCNENISQYFLDSVRSQGFLLHDQHDFLAIGCQGRIQNISSMERVPRSSLLQVLFFQYAEC